MNSTKLLTNDFFRHINLAYFIKFIALVIVLYYFNIWYAGHTEVGKSTYIPFLGDYLNYPAWLVSSVLNTSNLIAHLLGLQSYIDSPGILMTERGAAVILLTPCLGLGIMSFWIAFIIAQKDALSNKIFWCFAGILGIWIINCTRVALLLLALENKWKVNRYVDPHQMFNICSYILIMLMMYLYYKQSKKNG